MAKIYVGNLPFSATEQDLRSLPERRPPPGGERRGGRRDRAVHVLGRSQRELGRRRAGRGVP